MKFLYAATILSLLAAARGDSSDLATKCTLASPCKGIESIDVEKDFTTGNEYVMYSTSKETGDR